MTNKEIENQLEILIKNERKITNDILKLILLAEDRKLYLEKGYSSMFDWLTRGHKYSAAAAYRRIQAAKLFKAVPAIEHKIESGELSLSTLAKTQTIIQWQEKKSGEKIQSSIKENIIETVERKSPVDAERTLYQLFPELTQEASFEKATVISDSLTKLTLSMSYESLRKLERARDILSHKLPQGSLTDVIIFLINNFLDKKDPLTNKTLEIPHSNFNHKSLPVATFKSNDTLLTKTSPTTIEQINKDGRTKIKEAIRRYVIQKAKGKCEFKDIETGRECTSTYQLEIDHIYPVALGGSNNLENLRCLCRRHNNYVAQSVFHLPTTK